MHPLDLYIEEGIQSKKKLYSTITMSGGTGESQSSGRECQTGNNRGSLASQLPRSSRRHHHTAQAVKILSCIPNQRCDCRPQISHTVTSQPCHQAQFTNHAFILTWLYTDGLPQDVPVISRQGFPESGTSLLNHKYFSICCFVCLLLRLLLHKLLFSKKDFARFNVLTTTISL